MARTFKIVNSRTGEQIEETKAFDSTDEGAHGSWLNENNTCYEEGDENKPENDACDYQLQVFIDGQLASFNPETEDFELPTE